MAGADGNPFHAQALHQPERGGVAGVAVGDKGREAQSPEGKIDNRFCPFQRIPLPLVAPVEVPDRQKVHSCN